MEWKENYGDCLKNGLPEQSKNRREEFSGGEFPEHGSHCQRQSDARTDITTANRKAENQPCVEHGGEKYGVRQEGVTAAQGSQESVQQPQSCTQSQPPAEPDCLLCDGHPNRRRITPPDRFGSS